mgnify:CR=1 FL=1
MPSTKTEYPFIRKWINPKSSTGFTYTYVITRNRRILVESSRYKLEDAVAAVREVLLRDPVAFQGLSRETVEIILEKYNLRDEITLLL